jgi:hypothetical protein
MAKKKDIRTVFNTPDKIQLRTARVSFRTTLEVREKLKIIWDKRTYPDPYNPNKQLKFKSEQEYLEFVIRCLNKSGKSSWYLFSHMLNPDYPMEE